MSTYHNIIEPVKDFAAEVEFRVKRNPVLVGTAAIAAYSSLTAGHLTASAVVSVVVGFLVRSQVVPAHEVDAFVEHANHVLGVLHDALNQPAEVPEHILRREAAALPPAPAPVVEVPSAPAPAEAPPTA